MTKLWVGTNWKMHKSIKEGMKYADQLGRIVSELNADIEVFIIPSYTALWPIKNQIAHAPIRLGAQNMHWADSGAYTGEVSPLMLKEIGLEIVELGHSERRQYYNETDERINKKVLAALKHGLRPLICIGETRDQKHHSVAEEILSIQLKIALSGVGMADAERLLIAYEPVWAIGEEGVPADKRHVSRMHAHIRAILEQLLGREAGRSLPILYGGSVNRANSLEYLSLENVNGLFIGRAAWDIQSFGQILMDIDNFCRSGSKALRQ